MFLFEHISDKNIIRVFYSYALSKKQKGITLVELIVVVLIVATLAAIAAPSYLRYIRKAKNKDVVTEIQIIARNIELFKELYGQYPESLELVGEVPKDRWGNYYQYKKIEGVKGFGHMRKDRNMVPVNTDYDLYSMGADGLTSQSFQPKKSWDDIVRANNGDFIGLVSDY